MKITGKGLNEICRITNRMVNLKPWKVELGYGSFVTFEFGNILSNRSSPRAEWLLWIYMAPWEIELNNMLLASSMDERGKIEFYLKLFEEKRIEKVAIKNNLTTDFVFEENLWFKVFPLKRIKNDGEDISWMLYTPERMCLSIGQGPCLKFISEKSPRDNASIIDFYSS